MGTKTIRGVEILRTGTFEGVRGGKQTYTAADLDEFAAAHEAIEATGARTVRVSLNGGEVELPVGQTTAGHNEIDEKGRLLVEAPVVGRLTNLRRKGEVLLADIADVPEKLAPVLAGAYPQRSIEGIRLRFAALKVGSRTFRQAITGLALLGESLPAVKGLADLPRVLAEAGEDVVELDVVYQLSSDDPVEAALSALESWAEAVIPLIAGKTGAPIIRARVRSLKEDIRRIAGASSAGTVTQKENAVNNELRVALGLAENASADEVAAAFTALVASDPATALAVIAEILGMPEADPTALVAKVRELAGGGAADTGEEPMMQKSAKPNGAESAEVVELRKQVTELLTWKTQTEGDAIVAQAESLVDAAIYSGKFAPAQRETLVTLAKHDRAAFVKLAESQPVSVPLGERGTSEENPTAALEPSAGELDVAEKIVGNREAARTLLLAEKAEKAGVTLPAKGEEK